MIEENKIEEKVILYGPHSGKSLFRLYPDLKSIPEFKDLKSDELLFTWYLGIPNSPVDHDWDEKIRYTTAASKCFNDPVKRKKFASFDIPEEIKVAIRRWSKFEPEARSAAKNAIQKIFHNFMKLADVDVEKDFQTTREVGNGDKKTVVTETDWTAKKQYTDMGLKIAESMPVLLKELEDGSYGITEKKNADVGVGNKTIDKYHQQKQSS